jgi:lipopolysaccharide transport system permease protein
MRARTHKHELVRRGHQGTFTSHSHGSVPVDAPDGLSSASSPEEHLPAFAGSAPSPRAQIVLHPAYMRYSWDLVTHLVGREFRLRYRQALLGWLWAVGTPLARLVVLTYVFTRVLPLGVDNYAVFVFTGLIGWQWFSGGISSATTAAVDRPELLFRPGLPRAAVPVIGVLTDGLDYLAALPVLAIFLLLGDGVPLTTLALPLILMVQFLLTVGLGFALCTANVYLRDINLFVGVATLLGWYLTPVFYPASAVPERFSLLLRLNPMAHILDAQRAVVIEGTLPDLGSFSILTLVCGLIFVAGYLVYRRWSPVFVDEL